MKSFLKWLLRTLAEIAESEGGELLSVRDKVRLLRTQRYFRPDADASPPRKQPQAIGPNSLMHC
jgi:hypothetical protein